MMVGFALAVAVLVAGQLIQQEIFGQLLCSAPENLPCRPLTLECLFAGAGGLAAGLPAVPPGWGGFPQVGQGPLPPYLPPSDRPDQTPRDYAPTPPPGYEPPRRQSPQEALSDPAFQGIKDQWARDNADYVYPTGTDDSDRQTVADVLVQSIRNQGAGR